MFAGIKEGAVKLFNTVSTAAVENAPTLLIGGGLIAMGVGCFLACLATKKLDRVMEETRMDLEMAREVRESVKHMEEHPDDTEFDAYKHKDGTPYDKSDVRKITFSTYIRMIVRYAKLYGPAALTFIAGAIAILRGHGLLQKRFASMAAAATGLSATLNEYRNRVSDQIGAEQEEMLFRGGELRTIVEDVTDPETGEVTSTSKETMVVTNPILDDPYTYIFDECTTAHSRNWSAVNGVNLCTIRQAERNAQRALDTRPNGFLELNEVLVMLGLERDPNAIGIGWVNMPGCETRIDFGIRDYLKELGVEDSSSCGVKDFVLRFNCDGPIQEIRKRAIRAQKQGRVDYFCA